VKVKKNAWMAVGWLIGLHAACEPVNSLMWTITLLHTRARTLASWSRPPCHYQK